jgi:hypothetical protein
LNNVTNAIAFFNSQTAYITRADLSNFRQVRLICQVQTAGSSSTILQVRYRTSYNATASNWTDALGTSAVAVNLNTGGTVAISSWIDIAAGARGDIWLALLTSGGDGSADPIVGHISMEFRV